MLSTTGTSCRFRLRALAAAPLATLALGGALTPAAASARESTLGFGAKADTYVTAKYPTTVLGGSTDLSADGSPAKLAFLKFEIEGLAGRTVSSARLRLFAKDGSDSGGSAYLVSDNSWDESIDWNSRPVIDGPKLDDLGPVGTGRHYDFDVTDAIGADGELSLALSSASDDSVTWASRESSKSSPRLIVRFEAGDEVTDGISPIFGPLEGATDPTGTNLQHRLAITEQGRMLAVVVPHRGGPQVTWRDPAGSWETESSGHSESGRLLDGSSSGINPASIAVLDGPDGHEYAWVVFGGSSSSNTKPVYLRRLSDLDDPRGPRIGPLVTLVAGTSSKPDIQPQRNPTGPDRLAVSFARKGPSGGYQQVVGWIDDLGSETPVLDGVSVLAEGSSSKIWGTLAPGPGGEIRAVVRTGGRLVSFAHPSPAATGGWSRSAKGATATGYGYHSAVTLDSGETLAAVDSDPNNSRVTVQRFSPGNAPQPAELTLEGYFNPALATDGTTAWLVVVRRSDGFVVSRELGPGGWSATDRVEVGSEGGGGHAYPGLLSRVDDRLRLVVRGPAGGTATNAALSYQRPLFSAPQAPAAG